MRDLVRAWKPNETVSRQATAILMIGYVAMFLAVWWHSPWAVLPNPLEVLSAFKPLWLKMGLSRELGMSFRLNLEALAITAVLSVGAAYLTVVPALRPLVAVFSKFRFLSLVGLTFIFRLMMGGGHNLKLGLLVFGISTFFVTSMAAEVGAIPKEDFDHARTLGMSEWRVVWEVVVLGTLNKAIEVLRQCAAMGWMMLTMVEGISRSEGGVGTVLLDTSKHFHLAEVFAIQITILMLGLLQDVGIGFLHRKACPYAFLKLERR